MKIFIKNMVSDRCRTIVRNELDTLGIKHSIAGLGEVKITSKLKGEQESKLQLQLLKHGLEVLHHPKAVLAEKIRVVITEMIYRLGKKPLINYSVYISKKLGYDYAYLAKIFSKERGFTIERCIIAHKIERAKELLIYDELSVTEIARKLHYSSVSHFANQFKKVTGITTSDFKKQENERISLENVCA